MPRCRAKHGISGRRGHSVSLRPSGFRPARLPPPTHRDMAPGTSGGDVRQLEEALDRLGLDPAQSTASMTRRLRPRSSAGTERAGWEPFGPTREQRAAIVALERDGRMPSAADWRPRRRAKRRCERSPPHGLWRNRIRARLLSTERRVHGSSTGRRLKPNVRGPPCRDRRRRRCRHADQRTRFVLDPRQTEAARATSRGAVESGARRASARRSWRPISRFRPRSARPLWPRNESRSPRRP